MKIAPPLLIRFIALGVLSFGISSCAPLSSVKERSPRFVASVNNESAKEAEAEFRDARRLNNRKPVSGIAAYIAAADEAAQQLKVNPGDPVALESYNYALQRIFEGIREQELDPWNKTLVLGDYALTYRAADFSHINPANFEFVPDDLLNVRSAYLTEEATRDGLGAPLVAVGRKVHEDYREKFYTTSRWYYPMTAVARFEGNRCVLSLYDPIDHDEVDFAGREFPLAADFTSFLAIMMDQEGAKKLDLLGLLRPSNSITTARLARLQPYDPDRIPLVMVHGLMDSPVTWVPMLNHLRSDPKLRKKYQIWVYSYPSGYPYPYSAALLRKQLDAIEKVSPGRKPIVMMGHSMGGMITRLMLTDSGDSVWNSTIRKSSDELSVGAENRQFLEDTFIFESRPEIGRALFLAAPHQGSDLATNFIGRIGSSLVRLPGNMLDIGDSVLKVLTLDGTGIRLKRIPNSIDTLKPENPFVRAVAKLPLRPGVPYHTISGDRGKGGNKDRTKPMMSDGVVPYWSSHLEGAESEKIVPSNHSVHQNSEAMEEVRRILREHAGVQ